MGDLSSLKMPPAIHKSFATSAFNKNKDVSCGAWCKIVTFFVQLLYDDKILKKIESQKIFNNKK